MIFRATPKKSETPLVEQNRKLIYKFGFILWGRGVKHADLIGVLRFFGTEGPSRGV